MTINRPLPAGSTKQRILAFLDVRGEASGRELCDFLDISRQALNPHMRDLMAGGLVERRGATRGVRYFLGASPPAVESTRQKFKVSDFDSEKHFTELFKPLLQGKPMRRMLSALRRIGLP
ncbi:MAG: winged helix-turn-helix domain-containing protein [Pseudomonadota bacterium]